MILEEEKIPDIFDELDTASGSVLRTLVDFKLFDGKGNLLSIAEVASRASREVVTATGLVIEPIPVNFREKLALMTCTVNQDAFVKENAVKKGPLSPGAAAVVNIIEPPPPLDRAAIHVGQTVDGYCVKTLQWFESKILEVKTGSSSENPGQPITMVKVHFKGWNPKHDEWLESGSDRIQSLGFSGVIKQDAAANASRMSPWFESDTLLEKLQHEALLPERKEVSVCIRGIEDWCIDYSYANPTLWLVSKSGVWYRIAGPSLCHTNIRGVPHVDYAAYFASTSEQFFCAAHVSMVLLDLLPLSLRTSYQSVIDEVFARSKGEIHEFIILEHADFLIEQLGTLENPIEWNQNIEFSKCLFVKQLRKERSRFVESGGIEAAIDSCGSYKGQRGVLLRKMKEQRKAAMEELIAQEAAAHGLDLKAKQKYPMDDKEYWHCQLLKGFKSMPRPLPSTPQRVGSYAEGVWLCPSAHISDLLSVWSTLMNFRHILQLPIFSVQSMDSWLFAANGSSNKQKAKKEEISVPNYHPVIKEIVISIVSVILSSRQALFVTTTPDQQTPILDKGRLVLPVKVNNAMNTMDMPRAFVDSSTAGDTTDATVPQRKKANASFDNNSMLKVLYSECQCCLSLQSPLNQLAGNKSGAGSSYISQHHLHCGEDSWVEVLNILLAEQRDIAASLPTYYDPIAECIELVTLMLEDDDGAFFSAPVNESLEGNEGYYGRTPSPIDLATILVRLESGFYDDLSNHSFILGDIFVIGTHYSEVEVLLTFRKDIELLWANTLNFYGEDNDISRASGRLKEKFDIVFENRIMKYCKAHCSLSKETQSQDIQLNESASQSNGPSSTTSSKPPQYNERGGTVGSTSNQVEVKEDFLLALNRISRLLSSPATRLGISSSDMLRILQWLCDELLCTDEVRSFLDEVHETHLTSSEEKASNLEMLQKNYEAYTTKHAAKAGASPKALKGAMSPEMTGKKGKLLKNKAIEKCPHEACVRMTPIGTDRHGSVYFSFGNSVTGVNGQLHHWGIYCNDIKAGSLWFNYSTYSDIQALTSWLCDRGVAERKLLKNIQSWVIMSRVYDVDLFPLPPTDPVSGSCDDSMDVVQPSTKSKTNLQVTCETVTSKAQEMWTENTLFLGKAMLEQLCETHVMRQRIKLVEAKAETQSSSSGFESFEERFCNQYNVSAHLVSVSFTGTAVQLGVGVKEVVTPFGRSVVVTNYRYLDNNESPGKNAGLRIGDIIIVAEAMYVENILSLQKTLQRVSAATAPVGSHYLRLLVLRNKYPESSAVANELMSDPIFKTAMNQQKENDDEKDRKNNLCTDESYKSALPSRLLGQLLNILLLVSHPFAVPESYILTHLPDILAFSFYLMIDIASKAELNTVTTKTSSSKRKVSLPSSTRIAADVSKVESDVSTKRRRVSTSTSDSKLASPTSVSQPSYVTHGDAFGKYCAAVHSALGVKATCDISTCDSKSLTEMVYSFILQIMLSMESALFSSKTVLSSQWLNGNGMDLKGSQRYRQKWRMSLLKHEGFSYSHLSLSLAILNDNIDWSFYSSAIKSVDRNQFSNCIFPPLRNSLPFKSQEITYYSEGHLEAEAAVRDGSMPSMWGQTADPSKFSVHAVDCCVEQVKYFPCCALAIDMSPPAGKKAAAQHEVKNLAKFMDNGFPFVQITLKVLREPNRSSKWFCRKPDIVTGHPNASLCRRLSNVLDSHIMTIAEVANFLKPVCRKEYPEYYDIIEHPMDFECIGKRLMDRVYSSIDKFLDDTELIRSNCISFCSENFPSLISQVNIICDKILYWCERMCPEEFMSSKFAGIKSAESIESNAMVVTNDVNGNDTGSASFTEGDTFCVTMRMHPSSTVFMVAHQTLSSLHTKAPDVHLESSCFFRHYGRRTVLNDEGEEQTLPHVVTEGVIVGVKNFELFDVEAKVGMYPWRWLEVEVNTGLGTEVKHINLWDVVKF